MDRVMVAIAFATSLQHRVLGYVLVGVLPIMTVVAIVLYSRLFER